MDVAPVPRSFLHHLEVVAEKYGFSTVAAVALFLVVFGFIPSPLMENQKILTDNQNIMLEHQRESQESAEKQIELGRATCVNQALKNNDSLAANICFSSGAKQEYLIREAIEMKRDEGK